MIMWEFTSGIIPFNNEAYDLQLSLNIYKGKRPEIIKDTSQCYVNLMKSCWNINPSKRPIALDIKNIIKKFSSDTFLGSGKVLEFFFKFRIMFESVSKSK
ncbi:18215_t:CDS:2 [Funneliformis geosporum]|uniref:18215_t:CDS:1 n=1 Tax=Funneliformis geosporum TaxID=1117311 RepID=A0A9W4WUS7_9GLOM|nr:18215_t:CDS:2 [Funneliformis geosporum]